MTTSHVAIMAAPILSGIGQGIVWTGMWIAATSGVRYDRPVSNDDRETAQAA